MERELTDQNDRSTLSSDDGQWWSGAIECANAAEQATSKTTVHASFPAGPNRTKGAQYDAVKCDEAQW